MTSLWAGHEKISSGDTFETLHRGLTVTLISTQRDDLKMCSLDDSLSDVVARNTERYDHLPVTAEKGDKIIGLLHAVDFADKSSLIGRVKKYCRPLSEEYLIGADASILDFIKETDDDHPCRLVVSGTRIVGLVTLSDLQKLPVRATLFALITGLEISMSEAIRKEFPTGEGWLARLTDGRQRKIEKESENSKQAGGFVDKLLFTQFSDKAKILTKSSCFSHSKSELRRRLEAIRCLRDKLAHANDYAATPEEAHKVCALVRSLLELREEIWTTILNISPSSDSEKLAQLKQAVQDPLFLADLEETIELFAQTDSEWWEPKK